MADKVDLVFSPTVKDAETRKLFRSPAIDRLIAFVWWILPSGRAETATERTLRLKAELLATKLADALQALEVAKAEREVYTEERRGLTRIVAYHEARWKSLAEIAAIKVAKAVVR